MGAAQTYTAANIFTEALYKLRDPNGTNYNLDGEYAELLTYLNSCLRLIHEILIKEDSELVRTGTGTITTVAGTQYYSLADNTMGDLWAVRKLQRNRYAIWVSEYEPMTMCEEDDLYDAINNEESGNTSRTRPEEFCIIGDNLWFKDVPDAAYTVNVRYYPNFVPLTATTDAVPYKGLFNNEMVEGVVLLAKHRNEIGVQVDALLKDMMHERAMQVTRRRQKKCVSIVPRMR